LPAGQGWQDSNPRPTVLETAALPAELHPSAGPILPEVAPGPDAGPGRDADGRLARKSVVWPLRLFSVAALLAAVAGVAAIVEDARRPLPAPLHARPDVDRALRVTIGRSVEGRPIVAVRRGPAGARRVVLVVGSIHGDEPAGVPIARRLARAPAVPGVALWIVPTLNPDGLRAGTRGNARGVDLNRNFRAGWRAAPRGRYYPGRRPLSEPESRAAVGLVKRIRPDVTIWLHQPLGHVRADRESIPAARRFARLAGLPFRRYAWLPGSAPHWQNRRFPHAAAFVVELAPTVGRAASARLSRAIRRFARPRALAPAG
jgi:murein peptide amidase A